MKKILGPVAFIILLIILYCGAWLFMATQINKGIDDFYAADAPRIDIKFYGERPVLSGFPFTPVITYTKGFNTEDLDVTFSTLTIKGFPIPALPLTVTINDQIEITSKITKYSLDLDYLNATITVPSALPNSTRKHDIEAWQNSAGAIDIQNLETGKSGMTIKAQGTIGLDETLQPIIDLDTVLKGHEELIQFLVQSGELKPLPAAIAISALNAMVQIDPKTNEKVVFLKAKIQDRVLFLGPVRVMALPNIYWP